MTSRTGASVLLALGLPAACATGRGPGAQSYGVEQEEVLEAVAAGAGHAVLLHHEERARALDHPGGPLSFPSWRAPDRRAR